MVVRTNQMRNFPVVTARAYEGTVSRYDVVTPNGGIEEDVLVYSVPIVKGDLVKLKAHTTNGKILVEKLAADDELVHGIAVSDPQGIDNTTAHAGTPAAALQRKVDVAFFGIGIVELVVSSTGDVNPGDIVGQDSNEFNQVEVQTVFAAATIADNGGFMSLSHGSDGEYLPILVGASMFMGNA